MAAVATKRESVHRVKRWLRETLAQRGAGNGLSGEIQGQSPIVHTIKSSLGNALPVEAAGFV
jgi:hypothetical protein